MNKKVSIIMGIYNCEETLGETIESIIKQTYKNWEMIMCDDGSIDKTYGIANDYAEKDKRIKLIKNERNMGLAKTLNHCLEYATGDYIMRHDGDDLMVTDRIEKQVNYMETNNCDACGAGAYMFDEKGVWGLRQPAMLPDKKCMILGVPFIHATVIMKSDILLKVGGYTNNELTRQRLEDYDLWIKLFEQNFILHNIQEPLIYFREDKNSYNRKKKSFRITETKARLNACKRLNIPYILRIFALKPLIVMMIPKRMLRRYHIRKARIKSEG
jgi:glycosyltransferase EpsE